MLRRVVWKLRLMVTCYYDRVRTVIEEFWNFSRLKEKRKKNGFLKYLIAYASTLKVLETSDVEWMTCESDSWLQVTFVQVVIFLKFSFLLWEWNLFFSNLFILLQKIAASILKPEYSDNLLFPQFIPWNVTGNFFSHNPDK